MYKVFFNDSTILFDSEIKRSLKNNIKILNDIGGYDVVNQLICSLEIEKMPSEFFVLTQETEHAWKRFRKCFTEISAAGGLVQNSNGELLFIRRLGRWDLPKGKIEKRETPENAAVREVGEECGLSGLQVVRQLDSTFHIYRSPFLPENANLVLKETKWFLMDYKGNEKPVPQLEEDIVEVRWVSAEELNDVMKNTYLSLSEFLNKTLSPI